jgi:hypothetical protein
MLRRVSLWNVKNKCIGGCTWQKCYNENVMVKCQLQYWEIHENKFKYIQMNYKFIEISWKYIKIYYKYIINTININ